MVNNITRKRAGTKPAKYVPKQATSLVAFSPEIQNIAGRYASIFNDINASTESRTEAKDILNNLYSQMPDESNKIAFLMQT
jgi:hypothetical protein